MERITMFLMVISILVPACSYHGRILKRDDTSVVEIPAAQVGKSDSEAPAAAKNKSNEFEVVKPKNGNSAASLSSSAPRHFIDVFYGTAKTLDGAVSVSSESGGAFCLLPPCNVVHSVSRTVHFDPSSLYGIRVGTWLENYPYVGFAGELSYLQANAPGVRIWYVPLSFVMMGRYPFLRTESVPDGRLQLYGGVMISLIAGDLEVDFTPVMSKRGGSAGGLGAGALLGIAWHLPSFAVFGEFRMMRASLDFEEKGLFGGSSSASVDLDSRQMVFGVSYKY